MPYHTPQDPLKLASPTNPIITSTYPKALPGEGFVSGVDFNVPAAPAPTAPAAPAPTVPKAPAPTAPAAPAPGAPAAPAAPAPAAAPAPTAASTLANVFALTGITPPTGAAAPAKPDPQFPYALAGTEKGPSPSVKYYSGAGDYVNEKGNLVDTQGNEILVNGQPTYKGIQWTTSGQKYTAPGPTLTTEEQLAKFTAETEAALKLEGEAKKLALDQVRDTELAQLEQDFNNTTGRTKAFFAEKMGDAESTAELQYMNDLQGDYDEIKRQTASKYEIMKMNIDAGTKQSLLSAVEGKIKSINDAIAEKQKNLLESIKVAGTLYGELTKAEIESKKLVLEADRNRIQEAYNQDRISIDEYNAQINEAELAISQFNAETARIDVESKAAETVGAARPEYADFLFNMGQAMRMTLNPDEPEWKNLYQRMYPMTVTQARKTLTTEQQSRFEVVQSLIDKASMTLEEAQQIHPDISWLFHRPGLSFQELMNVRFNIPTESTETPTQ